MSVRIRGNSFQVIYRCPGEASPRTETFKSKDEALLRDMQIKLAKKNGTFEPPVKVAKGAVRIKQEVTIGDFLDEYVEVYGLKNGAIPITPCVRASSKTTSSPISEIGMYARLRCVM